MSACGICGPLARTVVTPRGCLRANASKLSVVEIVAVVAPGFAALVKTGEAASVRGIAKGGCSNHLLVMRVLSIE